MFDDRTIAAFGFASPPEAVRNFVASSLKLRSYFAKLLLPRSKPDFYTDSKLKSYPDGYKLSDLGPTKMLNTLNQNSEK